MTDLTVGYHNDRLVAVKESDDPARSARLRHEADLLSHLDHPGVVRLVDFTEGPPAILRTVFVGRDTWLRHAPGGEFQAPALAALIATVADLHETGIVHGALEAAHILVGEKHRPILCGLGYGNTACDAGIADDRRALAALIDQLGTDDALLAQARAELEDPSVSLRAVVRRLDMQSSVTVSTSRRFPRLTVPTIERRQFALPALVITAVLFLGVAALRLASGDKSVTATIPPPPTAPATTTTTAPAPSPSPPTPAPGAPTIDHGGRRYAVGDPGDVVILGDWTCDGVPTPAVLRRETGEVAVFVAWPTPGAHMEPEVVTTVEGAESFAPDSRPCPNVRVRTTGGSRIINLPEG